MIATHSKQRISSFQAHINGNAEKIREAGNNAWANVNAKGEVERVRKFLTGKDCGTDYLNSTLSSLLESEGRVVKFASIFLHQKPMVYGLKGTALTKSTRLRRACELGDLQTLFLYIDRTKVPCQMRSVIFQAKLKPRSGSYAIEHEQQRQLYDECPGFEYSSVLAGQQRRFPTGHLRERALQYVFVEEEPVQTKTIPANSGHGAFMDYGEHLLRLLNDSTGLDVGLNPKQKTGWDQIVWDMITHVANEVSSRGIIRNAGLSDLLDYFNSFEDRTNFSLDVTNGSLLRSAADGFGLQLVIVWDPDLGGEMTRGSSKPLDTLLAAAHEYVDLSCSVHAQKRALRKMLKIIADGNICRCDLAEAARNTHNEGLISALAAIAESKPERADVDRLLYVSSPVPRSNNTRVKIVKAIRALFGKRFVDKDYHSSILDLLGALACAKTPHAQELYEEIALFLGSTKPIPKPVIQTVRLEH